MVGNYCCATFISAAVRHVLMSLSTAGTALSRRRNKTLINIRTGTEGARHDGGWEGGEGGGREGARGEWGGREKREGVRKR